MKRVVRAAAAFGVAAFLTVSGGAAAQEMNEAAREPFAKGLEAAKLQDWPLAVRLLTEATKSTDNPIIWYNLGLAASKEPGYELRAIAWFRAYLVKAPDAVNAEAVKREIAALDARVLSTAGKLLAELQRQLPDVLSSVEAHVKRAQEELSIGITDLVYDELILKQAHAQASLGDTIGANRTLSAYPLKAAGDVSVSTWAEMAQAFAFAGDVDTALSLIATKVSDPPEQAPAYLAVIERLLREDKTAAAAAAAEKITGEFTRQSRSLGLIRPGPARAWLRLGCDAAAKGENADAAVFFERATASTTDESDKKVIAEVEAHFFGAEPDQKTQAIQAMRLADHGCPISPRLRAWDMLYAHYSPYTRFGREGAGLSGFLFPSIAYRYAPMPEGSPDEQQAHALKLLGLTSIKGYETYPDTMLGAFFTDFSRQKVLPPHDTMDIGLRVILNYLLARQQVIQ